MDNNHNTKEQLIQALAESRQRVARLETLAEVSRTISSTLHFQTILSEVAKLCCEAVDATSVYVGTVDRDAGTTTIIAEYFSPFASSKELESDLGVTYDMKTDFPSLVEWAKNPQNHYLAHAEDTEQYPEESQHLIDYGGKTSLVIPLIASHQFTGYIEVWESRRTRDFNADEIALLRSVAGQVSVVIDNARLYEDLRQSEDRYRVVSEIISDYAYRYMMRPDGSWNRIWTTDEAFKRLTGYDREELVGTYDLYHPDEQERVARDVELTLQGQPTEGEYRFITKAGDHRWLYLRRQPEWDEAHQRITGFYGAAQDITARKQLEIEHAYQASLLQNVSDAVISADSGWRIKSWNKGAERMYGWTAEEVIGKNAVELFQTEYFDETTLQQAATDFQHTGIWKGEALHICKDGQRIPVYISSSYVRDSGGEIIGSVTIIRNITDSKQAEAARTDIAVQQERIQLLEELIADLSHDIKTPLTSINSFLYLLRNNADRDKHEDYLTRLETQVRRLTTLLEAILTMSRLEKGADLRFAPFYLNSMIRNIHTQYHHLLDEKDIRLNFDLDEDLPQLIGNETEMTRALANLLVNAIHYTPAGGSITVRTAQLDEGITVEIRDTGIGIAEDELPRIFERFYRSDKARNSTQGGTGLGLAITKRIIELHTGTIGVSSTPGDGSCFKIRLPLSPQKATSDTP